MGWRQEFEESYQVPEEISNSMNDESWGNNVCPSFSKDGDFTTLWVEHPEKDQRENVFSDCRFSITQDDHSVILWEGNDMREALQQYDDISVKGAKKPICPDCEKEIWDIATIDQRLNKCWNCGLRFD